MNKDLIETTHHQTFESLKQEEDGCEFWSARQLAKALEYSEYRHFLPVVEKAKEACKNSGYNTVDHFEDILDMIEIGKGGQSFRCKIISLCLLFGCPEWRSGEARYCQWSDIFCESNQTTGIS